MAEVVTIGSRPRRPTPSWNCRTLPPGAVAADAAAATGRQAATARGHAARTDWRTTPTPWKTQAAGPRAERTPHRRSARSTSATTERRIESTTKTDWASARHAQPGGADSVPVIPRTVSDDARPSRLFWSSVRPVRKESRWRDAAEQLEPGKAVASDHRPPARPGDVHAHERPVAESSAATSGTHAPPPKPSFARRRGGTACQVVAPVVAAAVLRPRTTERLRPAPGLARRQHQAPGVRPQRPNRSTA